MQKIIVIKRKKSSRSRPTSPRCYNSQKRTLILPYKYMKLLLKKVNKKHNQMKYASRKVETIIRKKEMSEMKRMKYLLAHQHTALCVCVCVCVCGVEFELRASHYASALPHGPHPQTLLCVF
jgi:hypothetical protein